MTERGAGTRRADATRRRAGSDASAPAPGLFDTLRALLRRRPARRAPAPVRAPGPYDALVAEILAQHGLVVRRWRSRTTGIAVEVRHHDGRVERWIESPDPRGPVSLAVFLHEVGHHAIGFGRVRPQCLEELAAWRWALMTMRLHGIAITAAVERRMDEAMTEAVRRALRRGLRRIPPDLVRYAEAARAWEAERVRVRAEREP